MKTIKLLLTLTFLTFVQTAFPQEMRLISGTMVDDSKMPLPGVSILVKGTTNGTVSDINGKYSIQAPLGAILVYTYIGYINEEVVVTLGNSLPTGNYQTSSAYKSQPTYKAPSVKSSFTPILALPDFALETDCDTIGTARFTGNTPSFKVHDPNSPWQTNFYGHNKISSITYNSNKVTVDIAKDRYIKIPHISFSTSFSVDNINRLPKRQEQFAQGRPVNGTSQWRGPETGEMLSWGPALSNLEYDGSPTTFDKNGSLVSKGLGNGNVAKTYNPYDFFKTGVSLQNTLKISQKFDRKEYSLVYNNKQVFGTIPNSSKTGHYIEYKLERKFKKLKIKAQAVYDESKSKLMAANPVLSLLMASIETTPTTFDNSNELSRKEATRNEASYLLPNRTQRTFAPGLSNNPFWLINNLIDNEKTSVLSGLLENTYSFSNNFSLFVNETFENQVFTNSTGYKNAPNGITDAFYTNRTDKLNTNKTDAGLRFYAGNYRTNFNALLVYNYSNTTRSLNRKDYVVDDENVTMFENQANMETQNIGLSANLAHRDWLFARVTQNYLYTPYYKENNKQYSPSAALAINIRRFDDLFDYLDPLDEMISFFKVRSSWGYTLSGNLLAYTYGTYNYQNINSSQYANANFAYELLPNPNLKPEKILKKGFGADVGMYNNKLTFSIDAYYNNVSHGIFPQMQANTPVLQNLADYTSNGFEVDLTYNYHIGRNYNNCSHLRFILSRNRTKVTDLGNNLDNLPLGGYNDVYTALVKGQPNGVIVGTAYKRNEQGRLIIDNDGYPIVDEKLHVLGNPNPDFTMGLEFGFNIKNVYITAFLDAGVGGKRWNGTENALSYYGLSEKSVEGRKVLEYVYQGVKTNGTPNTTPVDFANPSRPIDQNRWYRYGITGVAEDAIQDASYLRVKQITIAFNKFKGRVHKGISLFVENPLVLTKYRGVNPEATLWGKSNTHGLDLFNLPSVWRVGINFTITL